MEVLKLAVEMLAVVAFIGLVVYSWLGPQKEFGDKW